MPPASWIWATVGSSLQFEIFLEHVYLAFIVSFSVHAELGTSLFQWTVSCRDVTGCASHLLWRALTVCWTVEVNVCRVVRQDMFVFGMTHPAQLWAAQCSINWGRDQRCLFIQPVVNKHAPSQTQFLFLSLSLSALKFQMKLNGTNFFLSHRNSNISQLLYYIDVPILWGEVFKNKYRNEQQILFAPPRFISEHLLPPNSHWFRLHPRCCFVCFNTWMKFVDRMPSSTTADINYI